MDGVNFEIQGLIHKDVGASLMLTAVKTTENRKDFKNVKTF